MPMLAGVAAAVAVAAVVGIPWGLAAYHVYHGFGSQEGVVRRGPDEPMVALTFDDGPSPVYTPQILDILATKGVKATFFVVGEHVRSYPDVARRIVADGHDIGNHTNAHRSLVPAATKTASAELNACASAIEEVTGVRPVLFRPPRGLYANAVRRLAMGDGYRIVLWGLSAMDWRRKSARAILRRVRARLRPGEIILCHDSGALVRNEGGARDNIVEALPGIIDYLRQERGYEIIPVSEMLKRLDEEAGEPATVRKEE